jgi:hypothetical protein
VNDEAQNEQEPEDDGSEATHEAIPDRPDEATEYEQSDVGTEQHGEDA